MNINSSDVAKLRGATGAGMMDCRKALEESGGDFDRAVKYLRERGVAKAAKRAGKVAAEGAVVSYIHGEGKIGVLLEVNSETDFVAKNDIFKKLTADLAMHIAAAAPRYLSPADVPKAEIESEKSVERVQLEAAGKPKEMIEKIVEGKLDKYYSQVCLLKQPFIKDEDKIVEQLLAEKTAEIGEKISVRRFVRYELGEGIEAVKKNLAQEVEETLAA